MRASSDVVALSAPASPEAFAGAEQCANIGGRSLFDPSGNSIFIQRDEPAEPEYGGSRKLTAAEALDRR